MKNSNKFNSKADTLTFLRKKITRGKIEEIFSFTVLDWQAGEKQIIEKIVKKFYPDEIIVRSSAIGEDSVDATEAGKYKSIQKISTHNKKNIENSVNEVIKTYTERKNKNQENQVLIQRQTTKVISNGVVFTRTPDNGSPYYVINFSDSKDTDNVTKGEISNLVKIFRGCQKEIIPKKWEKLIFVLEEIESIFKTDFLDIEFGITKKDIVIFQVRPLTTIKKELEIENLQEKIKGLIKENQRKYQKLRLKENSKKDLYFSDMVDWNPAEIIGNNPNPLDYSIYDFLLMQDSWQKGRIKLGYEKNNQSNLMEKFGNKPYINIRKSFYSLFPEKLSKKTKNKLMKFYFKKLEQNPHLHDKVEFYILFSCYDFTFNDRKKELEKFGFNKNEINEIKEKLVEFTNKIIEDFPTIKESHIKDIEQMTKNRNKVDLEIFSDSKNKKTYFEYVKNLLSDCKKYGAINFSSIARIAFIGNILLKSLKEKNVIDENFVYEIMSSISSPLLEIQNDLDLYKKKKLTEKDFLNKYGHLRPGTYDITAERYDENKEFLQNIKFLKKSEVKIQKYQRNIKIKNILNNNGICVNDNQFIDFLKEAIRLREVLKFEFTKNLSDALSLIVKGGKNFGFSRNELSYLELKDIFCLKKLNKKKIHSYCNKKIIENQKRKKINEFLVMPPLIFSEKDFQIINYNLSKPNFITLKKITADIQKISNIQNKNVNFSKKIIFIENADPGYDWIFTKNPAALITKYGGVASHMAIRCAELGLPAAIGIGEIIFQKIDNAKKILLDCENQQIIVLENSKKNQYIEEEKILKSLGYIK